MTGFNPYAAGNKVYGGGSSAAHSGGGLDPMGYIQRSINQQQSQQRSGFAAAALARLGYGQGGANGGPFGGLQRRIGSGSNKKDDKKKSKKPSTPSASRPQTPNAPGVQELPNDSLNLRTPIISSPTGQLSFDPSIIQELAQAEFDFGNNAASLDVQQSDLTNQYNAANRDLGIQRTDDQRNDLNRFAGRGMAYSSGYGQEVADSAQAYNNAFADVNNQYNTGITGIGNQRNANQQFILTARSMAAQRQAALNAQNAGSLGLSGVDGSATSVVTPQTPGMPAAAPASAAPSAASGLGPALGALLSRRIGTAPEQPVSRAAFLAAHPALQYIVNSHNPIRLAQFLANNPGIARAWSRY